ncbi:MAG TPA: transposase [Kofleriaceae bacterium]|nr:transposase [Kofleriaceae bacterium]
MGRQVEMVLNTHGGKRAGAGRPAVVGRRCSEPHVKRPKIDAHKPLHVVLRAVRGINLRQKVPFTAIREALKRVDSSLVRVVHISIQRTHVHLIVESRQRLRLAHGLQGLQISMAKRLNRALGTSGQVFADRYFATPLNSPRQVRNTLAYVLNNWRHHDEHRHAFAATWTRDPFSSALVFEGWSDAPRSLSTPSSYEPPLVCEPKTWLLRVGWKRHPRISCFAVPGGAHAE